MKTDVTAKNESQSLTFPLDSWKLQIGNNQKFVFKFVRIIMNRVLGGPQRQLGGLLEGGKGEMIKKMKKKKEKGKNICLICTIGHCPTQGRSPKTKVI